MLPEGWKSWHRRAADALLSVPDLLEFDPVGFRLALHNEPEFAGAPLSPYRINMELLCSYPRVRKPVAALMSRAIEQAALQFDRFVDTPMGVSPLLITLDDLREVGILSPRVGKYAAKGERLVGDFQPGMTVLLVDDVITGATTKLSHITFLRGKGLVVSDVLVVIEREHIGRERLEREGIRLHACLRAIDLAMYACNQGKITGDQYEGVIEYGKQLQVFCP